MAHLLLDIKKYLGTSFNSQTKSTHNLISGISTSISTTWIKPQCFSRQDNGYCRIRRQNIIHDFLLQLYIPVANNKQDNAI